MLSASSTVDIWAQGGAFGALGALALYMLKRSDAREAKAMAAYGDHLADKDAQIVALNDRVTALEAKAADCFARLETLTKQPRRKAPQ